MLTMPTPVEPRRHLPQVTLCCIDTRTPELALYAMRRSMQHLAFGRCVLISTSAARTLPLDGIELVEIPALTSIDGYSRFVLKDLAPHLHTRHMLLIQWDGFVRDASLWRDEFLDFDYIGAPWVSGELAGQVGNGGFTLRSRRLLQALQADRYPAHNPEDVCLAVTHRGALEVEGIRFADLSTAQAFACERGPWRPAFGFHAMFNLPHVLLPSEQEEFVRELPAAMCKSPDARHLLKNLIKAKNLGAAKALHLKRYEQMPINADAMRMQLRIQALTLSKLFSRT